jgi:hypothetical protein
MHWRLLVLGSQIYRDKEPKDALYDDHIGIWEGLPTLEEFSISHAQRLIDFINRWSTRSPLNAEHLQAGYASAYPILLQLADRRLVSLALHPEELSEVQSGLAQAFDLVARCGPRNESTGASKILHVLLPSLFTMWDMRIAAGYGIYRDTSEPRPDGQAYACTFLPRICAQLREALTTLCLEYGRETANAVMQLEKSNSGRTVPKMIDQYNFAKFTLNAQRLWEVELPTDEELGRSVYAFA